MSDVYAAATAPVPTVLQAGDQLAVANLPLGGFLAEKYRGWAEARGVAFDDVLSEAKLSVLLACREHAAVRPDVPLGGWIASRVRFAILRLRETKGCRWRHCQLPADADGIELEPADVNDEGPDADLVTQDDKGRVADLLRRLPGRERRAVEMAFGLDGGGERPLDQIGRDPRARQAAAR
jgi:hypothetical protein